MNTIYCSLLGDGYRVHFWRLLKHLQEFLFSEAYSLSDRKGMPTRRNRGILIIMYFVRWVNGELVALVRATRGRLIDSYPADLRCFVHFRETCSSNYMY